MLELCKGTVAGREKMTNNKHNDDPFVHRETPEQQDPFRVIQDGNAVKKERENDVTPIHYRPKQVREKNWIAPIFLTILTAGAVGTVLGMFIINLFTGIENEQVGEDRNPTSTSAVTAQGTNDQVHAGSLPVLAGYVLQAGLFEEQANAEEWQQTYTSAGQPAFIWERDEQYFLLIGIYHTEDQAKQRAVELQGEGFDVFVKAWQTTEKELELPEDASAWIGQFGQVFEDALTAKENTSLMNHLERAPQADRLAGLVESLEEPTEEIEVYLLQVMQAYDSL